MSWQSNRRNVCAIGAFALLLSTTAGAQEPIRMSGDSLEFLNGDRLKGTLVSIGTGDFALNWRHAAVEQSIAFSIEGVAQVQLGKRSGQGRRDHSAAVHLTNGDRLDGEIFSLNADTLVLDTWYSGRITIPRPMVQTIRPNMAAAGVAYEGPTGIEGWTFRTHNDQPSWTFRKGSLYAAQQYPIGRTVPTLSDTVNFELELGWRGYPSFSFSFFTDNLQSTSGNCYMLHVSSTSGYLYRYTRNSGSHNMGTVKLPQFGNQMRGRAAFSVLVDKPKKQIVLLVDGQVVKQWTDTKTFAGGGNGIVLQPHNQANLKISHIRIAEWDGAIPEKETAGRRPKEDLVEFENGDKLSGTLKGVGDGTLSFATSYATMAIPVSKVVRIDMSSARSGRAGRSRDDVRVEFTDRGLVTLRLQAVENGALTGASENFGSLSVPLHALRAVEFNVCDERAEPDDELAF